MPKKKNPILKAAIVDTETTGLKARDELIELTIILFTFNRETGERVELLEEYTGLREPGCEIDPIAAKKHGLTLDTLRGHCLDDERVCALLKQADYLIAHNASFDRRFINALYPDLSTSKWLCTVQGFNWHSKGFNNEKLETLLKGHGIVREQVHRAGDDARALMELLFRVDVQTGKPYFLELTSAKPLSRSRTRSSQLSGPKEMTASPSVPRNRPEPKQDVVIITPVFPVVGEKPTRRWMPWQIGAAVAGFLVLGCLGLSVLGRLLGY